jgi:hypothetical protein
VRRPVTEEWARFESYARRIKVLSCFSGWPVVNEMIEEEMFEALADHFQESPVLPNLRHISCYKDALVNKYMGLFLAPRLTRLLFSPSICDGPSPATVESIKTACPNLRNLEIRSNFLSTLFPDGLPTLMSTLIGSLSALESLHCDFPLSPAAIRHLSRLPSLKKVNFRDHPHAIVKSLAGTSAPAFAYLTTLVINAWDTRSTANLLGALYLKKLKNLKINLYWPSDVVHYGELLKLYHPHAFYNYQSGWPEIDGLLTAIQASCDGLQSLSITPRRGKNISPLSPPNNITPLFSLRNLTSLGIGGICQYGLDDTILKEMANAWPLLRYLNVFVSREDFQPKATLKGLAAIISGCSHLREVYVAIHVSAVQTRDINVKEHNSNDSIIELHLDTSLVDDDVNLVELAEVFAILCPKLAYLRIKPASVWRILQNLLTTRDKTSIQTCQ